MCFLSMPLSYIVFICYSHSFSLPLYPIFSFIYSTQFAILTYLSICLYLAQTSTIIRPSFFFPAYRSYPTNSATQNANVQSKCNEIFSFMAFTCFARCLCIRFNLSYFSLYFPHIFVPHYLLCSLQRHFSKRLQVVSFLDAVAISKNSTFHLKLRQMMMMMTIMMMMTTMTTSMTTTNNKPKPDVVASRFVSCMHRSHTVRGKKITGKHNQF